MYESLDPLNPTISCDTEENSLSSYQTLAMLAALATTIFALAKIIESKNHLNYKSPTARLIAGYFVIMMGLLHLSSDNKKIPNPDGSLYAINHQSGIDAAAFAVLLEGGTPPRFMATTAFNKMIPGLKWFLEKFLAIPVPADAAKRSDGRSANADAIDEAVRALKKNDCVAIFPQGGFSLIGEDPRLVYSGIAQCAIEADKPIRVVRLDGFSFLQNGWIPLAVRNNSIYRAFCSMLHPNNIRGRECFEIDFHLKNKDASYEEKVRQISAQLYAVFAPEDGLTDEELQTITEKVTTSTDHLKFWDDRVRLRAVEKERVELKASLRKQGDALRTPSTPTEEETKAVPAPSF